MAVILVIAVIAVIAFMMHSKANEAPIEPKTLDNKTLLGAIAGQAEWLDKMVKSDWEIQGKKSIMAIATKRRSYIADLCQEVISRDLFIDTAELAKELEKTGIAKKAAVKAVRQKLFKENGVYFIASWEEGEPNIDALNPPPR